MTTMAPMGLWLGLAALLLGACTFDPAPTGSCHRDEDCAAGACRDGACVSFSTPLDEPVDPGHLPDAGDDDAAP